MKLTVFLLLVSVAGVFANKSYSQTKMLNLNMHDASVKEVLKSIEKQSEFYFLFSENLIDVGRKVNVDIENQKIEQALNLIFEGTDVEYSIRDRVIVLTSPEILTRDLTVLLQQKSVSGRVTDSADLPLPGVTVVIKGTTQGTVTNGDGEYSLTNIPEDATLVFSFVGMRTQEVEVGNQSTINVSMEVDAIGIEEVVAVGYGVSKKTDVTGSILSVSSENFKNEPVTDVMSALQGRAAGVAISNVSGAPGGDVRIRIRGANSITGGNDPLFVVDGMQLSSFNMNDLNPSDIESMEVLKDASATAIYGSRGANGVILITTKTGRTVDSKVDFTANFGISEVANKYNLLDPVSFAKQYNLVHPGGYSQEEINKFENGFGTDWQDEVFQMGNTQDYQVSISGSSPKTSYLISGRYLDQTGIVINTSFKRFSFHSNIETKLFNKITLSAAAFLNRTNGFNNQVVGSLRGGVEQAILWSPTAPVYIEDEDGNKIYNYSDPRGAAGKNPVANLREAHQDNIVNSAMINTKLSYDIFDYLKLDIVGGVDANLGETSNVLGRYADFTDLASMSASRQHNTSFSLLNSNILTFHKLFNEVHDLTVTGVFELSKNVYDYTYAKGQGSLFTEQIGYYGLGKQTIKEINSGYQKSTGMSYVGRLSYALSGKYLLTASYRADGSSKFPNNRWAYFPSFGVGWRVSEEDFMQKQDLVSNLKLRGSWGVTGNHGVGPFRTIPQMASRDFGYGGESATVYYISNSVASSDLKWEETAQTDVGFDIGFLKNRLNFSADYFKKKTKDLLLNVPTPAYWGGGSILNNVGKVENEGFEFSLSAMPIKKNDLTWNMGIQFSSYKNKVVELGGGATYINSTITNLTGTGIAQNDMLRIIVGEPIGTFWGLESLGIWQENEAAEAAEFGLQPGDYKYRDLNEDKIIDAEDKKIIGHSLPKYTWSFDNTVTYKNFELNVFIMAVHGNKINNFDYSQSCTIGGDTKAIVNADVVSWTPSNNSNKWPALGTGTGPNDLTSSRFLQDGSFIRLKNLSLSYRFPSSIIRGAPLKLSVSGQNLLTITDFKGYDPEATSGGGADINQGVVSGAYPSPRVITFSLNLNF